MESILKELSDNLDLCIVKKDNTPRCVSVAISESKRKYFSGSVESDTNTFNLPSEHIALMLSSISNDYKVYEIITITEEEEFILSPIILKIIIDHSIRTGVSIRYKIYNKRKEIVFDIEKVTIDFYKPKEIKLSRIDQLPEPYQIKIDKNKDFKNQIKEYAMKGLSKNFPLYDSASGYATAVLTEDGDIFFAGQYSSPDKRLGMHSEVNAMLASIMNRKTKITHIGLVSTKYTNSPCNMCGNCRQFISEMSTKFTLNPVIYLFSKDTDDYIEQHIDNYLPLKWTSKNW